MIEWTSQAVALQTLLGVNARKANVQMICVGKGKETLSVGACVNASVV